MIIFYRITCLMLLLVLGSGCGGGAPGRVVIEKEPEAISGNPSPVVDGITKTPEISYTVSPSPAPEEHPLYFTPTQIKPPTDTPAPTRTASRVCSPLQGHSLTDLKEIVTNPFDPPPPGKDTGHHGVDFAYYRRGERLSILGVPVQSVMAGVVAAVVNNRVPYGNMTIIETRREDLPQGLAKLLGVPSGASVYVLYAHMKDHPNLILGASVECGQSLGEVGNTPKGWSSDPHLHLEGRVGPEGVQFNGIAFYDNSASLEELANYKRWRMSGDFGMFDPMKMLNWGLSQN